jgi:hypothetical protein
MATAQHFGETKPKDSPDKKGKDDKQGSRQVSGGIDPLNLARNYVNEVCNDYVEGEVQACCPNGRVH